MSNKLAKVLVICALVVVLPLFVAGTVIAVYNSLNSTINVEVYTGEKEEGRTYPQEPTITSDAEIAQVDNEGVISYQVTNGLNKQTNIEYASVGYNFVGWFNGTRAEYIQALGNLQDGEQITYIQETPNQVLTVNQGDYSNITAVFEVISYNFDFYYQQTPNGEYVTTAPTGRNEFVYGENLPTFNNTDTHDFLGWAIYDEDTQTTIGEPSKVANFATTDGLTLTTVWQEVKTYRVEYYDEDGMLDNDTDTFTTRNYQDYQLQIPDARVGYTASWKDASGNVITSITQEMLEGNEASLTIRLYLTYSANTYSASFTGANGATFTGGSRTATFTIEDSSELSKYDVDSNWSHSDGYSYTVASYSYNGNSYNTIDALVQAIATRNPQSQVSVQVNFSRITETFTVNYYDGTSLAGTKRFSETSIPTIALTDYEEENLGYDIEYIYNGRVVNAITSQMLNENRGSHTLRIEIRKTAHEFTANFTATNATFEGGSNNVTFTVNSLDQLNRYAEADNWAHTDYIWNLTNFTYNNNTYDNLTDLANAIMQDRPTNTVSVQVNFERVVTEYTLRYMINEAVETTQTFMDNTTPSIPLNALQQDNLGYSLSYAYNGTTANVVTSEMLRENRDDRTIDIDVTRSIINFTVYVSGGDYGFTGNRTINVNVENYSTSLANVVSATSWERYSNVYDFQGISYAGQTHNSTVFLWNAIITNYYQNSTGTSITVTPIVDELVSTLVLTNGIAYEDGVQNSGGDLLDDATRKEFSMSNTILGDIIPNDTYQQDGHAVSPSQLYWNNGESSISVSIDSLSGNTIAAFVDYILGQGAVNNDGTVEISSITIYFDEI